MKAIERFIGKGILRVTIPDFDYKKQPTPMSGEERGGGGRGRDRERGGHSGGGHGGRSANGSSSGGRSQPTRQVSSTPSEPVHGRKPRRQAPGAGRKRM
jgi:hypothetical protein